MRRGHSTSTSTQAQSQAQACKIVETVPDDFFSACSATDRSACRQETVPAGVQKIAAEYAAHVGHSGKAPDVYAMQVPCSSTFGGRWFAPGFKGAQRESIVVILTGGEYERAVTVHEMTHWLRWRDSDDKMGRHDKAFLAEVEKAYRHFGISTATAKAVEHEPKGFMAGGRCFGQAHGNYLDDVSFMSGAHGEHTGHCGYLAGRRSVGAKRKWSSKVETHWHPEEGFFTRSGREIAEGLRRSSDSLQTAMARLTFYVNRAGHNLDATARRRLQDAKLRLHRMKW